ncbi:unnamed protein product [Mytilus edulis]|uniref:B box-type domain-containing protein n=1 Tax=Mytilus edulis TaxID=6550 RepID=A0A8S3T163_MYTED|nr:unnamed protein product [Mytilus edulis]
MDMIYCCEADKNTIHCIDINGTDIFSYKSPDFEGPVDLALDDRENMYEITRKSNKLHRLPSDGKLIDILLKTEIGKMDMIYCSELYKNTLHCIDINGTVIFSYKSTSFDGPVDMTLDGKDNLYVTTLRSNKLHLLSSDGKLLDILLKKLRENKDELNEPNAVAFNENYIKLVIMATSQKCGPCYRVDKLASAVKFCTDCEDPLCADCAIMHKAIKSLALHHLTDEDVQTDKAFSIRRNCSDHPDMGLEFYCSNHEKLCCRTCSVNTHRTCGNILPIDVAARGIKTSVLLNDVTADLKGLLKTAGQLVEDRAKTWKTLEKIKRPLYKR